MAGNPKRSIKQIKKEAESLKGRKASKPGSFMKKKSGRKK